MSTIWIFIFMTFLQNKLKTLNKNIFNPLQAKWSHPIPNDKTIKQYSIHFCEFEKIFCNILSTRDVFGNKSSVYDGAFLHKKE